jgi:hypothetical protein
MSKKIGQQKEKEPPAQLTFFEESHLLHGGWEHLVKWSEEEARAAWMVHRERLLKEFVGKGERPNAFWRFDYPGVLEQFANPDGHTYGIDELKALAQIGEATSEELQMLEDGVDPYEEGKIKAWKKAKGARVKH